MLLRERTWRRPALAGSDAWYDTRRAVAVTTARGRKTIFEAISQHEAESIGDGALVIHELTHLQQDLCTGWGFYQSELRAALVNARLWLVSHALKAYAGVKPPLDANVGNAGFAKCSPALFDHYVGLQQLWNHFNDRTGEFLNVPDIHVLESQAHARQIVEHILALDLPVVNELLDAEPEYTQLLHATRQAFGFPETSDPGRLMLLLLLHDKTCELALAAPAPAIPKPLKPGRMSVGDFKAAMPDGLVVRFERILAVAMEHFAGLGVKPLPGGKSGAEQTLGHVATYANHSKWLEDVAVRTGPALSQGWLHAIASPALLTEAQATATNDPNRFYRGRMMSTWQPFSPQPKPEDSLAALLRQLPAFRLEHGGEIEWVMNLSVGMGLKPLSLANELLDQYASDCDGMATFDGFSSEYLFGPEAAAACPQREGCKERGKPCDRSIVAGMTPTCRVTKDLAGYASIPLASLSFKPR